MKLWGGRFSKGTDSLVEEFSSSLSFDIALYREDIVGSLAHVAMLAHCQILEPDEAEAISAGLKRVAKKIEAGEAVFAIEDEDVHMNIERMLHQEIGDVAGKLHTGRSRNDQVATDTHLYLRDQLLSTVSALAGLQEALLGQAAEHLDTVLPGYTHLQRAQPVVLAHHLLAYFWMFERDAERLMSSWQRVNVLPLGAGALAGTTFPIDRQYAAELLRFESIYQNSMDAVSDRDYLVEYVFNASLVLTHLSRFSEELILWSSREFGFVEIDDGFSTGSSMMPQKKNPDVAELVRGKSGRVFGDLASLLMVLKGLPLTYNRDLQEDKEPVFDAAETVIGALKLFAPMVHSLSFNAERMREAVEKDFSNATDLADYLVRKGIPFRKAHEIVGRAVLYCIENSKFLLELSLEEFHRFSEEIDQSVYQQLAVDQVVDSRASLGGTARSAVKTQLDCATELLCKTEEWVAIKRKAIELSAEFNWESN